MRRLRVAFDSMPFARWGPLFHVLCLEQPGLRLEWRPVPVPVPRRSRLEDADVGVFVAPPDDPGFEALTIETSRMHVVAAVGHRLAQQDMLAVADILEEPFPGGCDADPDWRRFWTLDEHRGGPPAFSDHRVETVAEAVHIVASGCAIATVPATIASSLPHPGVVSIPLTDGPAIPTRLVWRKGDDHPLVDALVDLARDMTFTLPGESDRRLTRHAGRRRGRS